MSGATLLTRLQAQAGFEAARRTRLGLHGHSFVAQARAAAGSLAQLQQLLTERLVGFNLSQLNNLVGDPDDAPLAAWIAQGLGAAQLEELVLHAGADQGARWTPSATTHWRRYSFEAAHRLPHVPAGHKCGRLHGHGFAVLVNADAPQASIDAAWLPLHAQLNRRCLNTLPGLDNPTSEVIAAWLWQRLADTLAGLERVTVFETGSSGAAYDGARFAIWKQFTLDSAVTEGDALLGHTYALRLHLSAPLHEVLGWVVDFGDVKTAFAPVFEQLDHQPLHEGLGAAAAEVAGLARWVHNEAVAVLPQLDRVDLFETPGCGVLVARDVAAFGAGP